MIKIFVIMNIYECRGFDPEESKPLHACARNSLVNAFYSLNQLT